MPTISAGIKHLMKSDPVLREIIVKTGNYKPNYLPLSVESLCKIIISQSLSKEAAEKIFSRFKILTCGDYSIASFSLLENSALRRIGLSTQKINTIKEIVNTLQSKQYGF